MQGINLFLLHTVPCPYPPVGGVIVTTVTVAILQRAFITQNYIIAVGATIVVGIARSSHPKGTGVNFSN